MKRRDLEQHLRRHGCKRGEHGAKHDEWLNPRRNLITVIPRHSEIPTGTALGICKQLGVPKPSFR
jgi:hypothetical protein